MFYSLAWKVNGVEKATIAKFDFSASEVGTYKIVLSVTNEDGMTADSVNVMVYGKYRDGVFVLNEGNMTSENGFLTFISSKGEVTDSAYYKANGSSLGNVTQSLFIADKKMYIISQNGNRMLTKFSPNKKLINIYLLSQIKSKHISTG